MPSKKSRFQMINIGTASLLVVFFTLCMTVFAVLSLSAAQNDYSFSEKLAVRTTQYYNANNKAEQKLAVVQTLLQEYPDARQAKLAPLLSPYEIQCRDSADQNSLLLSWQIPINASSQLECQLEAAHTQTRILRWQVVNTADWGASQTLNLIPISNESEE